jgi:CheY-like chemotaxis protein
LVVVVTPVAEDSAMVCEVLGALDWPVARFATLEEAKPAMERASVVLCDAEMPDGNWREAVETLEGFVDPAMLVVASRLADERLWSEVLNEGGHDVLAKPFRPAEVLQSIASAYRWRDTCTGWRRKLKGHASPVI